MTSDAAGGLPAWFSLAGQVALVTGSSRGIGLAIAEAFAAAGAHVVLNGRDADVLRRCAAALAGRSDGVSTAPFDAADEAAVGAAVDTIVADHGRLDIVVGNAGTALRKGITAMTSDELHGQLALNLESCFYLARAAAPHMERQGSGRMIFTASIMGAVARPIPAYVASKAGVRGLAKALATELGPKGITCNAIAPGFIATDLTQPLADDAAFDDWVKERTPLGRWGTPAEVAAAALYLAAPAGAYCNGHTLVVDGGMTINA